MHNGDIIGTHVDGNIGIIWRTRDLSPSSLTGSRILNIDIQHEGIVNNSNCLILVLCALKATTKTREIGIASTEVAS